MWSWCEDQDTSQIDLTSDHSENQIADETAWSDHCGIRAKSAETNREQVVLVRTEVRDKSFNVNVELTVDSH